MKKRFYLWLAACFVLLLGISISVPAKSDDSVGAGFTEADAEYFLPEDVFFFFRPGLKFELTSVEIPADLQPLVTFKITDPGGYPLDILDGDDVIQSGSTPVPAPVDIRFMLSYIPAGQEQKVTYHDADNGRGRDRGGVYTSLGGGEFTYKFGTVLPADYEADSTHTLISAPRREFDDYPELIAQGVEEDYYDSNVHNFVPSGASNPMPRDIVTTATCNKCHLNSLNMNHGTRYQHPQACQNCHNPEYMDERDAPERVLNVMIHEIHSSQLVEDGEVLEVRYPADLNDCEVCHTGGAPTDDLPLVASPNPITTCDGSGVGMTTIEWADAGPVDIRLNAADGRLFAKANGAGSADTGNWVKDGKQFYLTDSASGEILGRTQANLTVFGCAGNPPYDYGAYLTDEDGNLSLAALHSNWLTRPQRGACGGCHTYIDWETGEGHPGGPAADDEFCSFCHEADSGDEFDRSVKGAHTVVERSAQLDGVYVDIKSITNTGPGLSPTVTFAVFGKSGPIDPNTMNRLRFVLVGPNEDFDFRLQENVAGSAVASGANWTYTFSGKLPMDAKGSYSLGFEGRNIVTIEGLPEDEAEVRDLAENYLVPFAVTGGSAVARDMIVDDVKCEACHSNLALHGGNRHNGGQYCQTCHLPDALGPTEVEEGQEDSIHFKFMVHKIHRGADLENGYVMEGSDFSDVHFPGDLRECEMCHVNDSYELPLPAGRLPTTTPVSYLTEMQPITAACLSCHDGLSAAQHAQANSGDLGESCNTCHAEGRTYAVSRVHAR
jgi:hypothetical protein